MIRLEPFLVHVKSFWNTYGLDYVTRAYFDLSQSNLLLSNLSSGISEHTLSPPTSNQPRDLNTGVRQPVYFS